MEPHHKKVTLIQRVILHKMDGKALYFRETLTQYP